VEGIKGATLLLSGADLVDGTDVGLAGVGCSRFLT
jgi:hypothetical protein